MSYPSRACAVALLAASLAGCQSMTNAISGAGGVMPDTEVGPPPSMSGALKNSPRRTASNVDEDGAPMATSPTRQIALPKNAAAAGGRTAEAGQRRINREELDGGNGAINRGGGNSLGFSPSVTPGGGMGMGAKF